MGLLGCRNDYMFDLAFVHEKKNEKHWDKIREGYIYISGTRENISIWKRFTNLDDLVNSPLWLEPCDLQKPLYAVGGDYCPLCTQDTHHEEIKEIFNWGGCKDCIVTHCDEKYESDYTGIDYTIIGEVNNRPIIFVYWNKPDYRTNTFIDEVETYLQEINKKIGVQRQYKKERIDESPEKIAQLKKKYEDGWKKREIQEQKEHEEYLKHEKYLKQHKISSVQTYYTRDEKGNMVEISPNEEYDPYANFK